MEAAVIDSSAILALLGDEPGGEAVETILAQSMISAANACEVLSKLIQRGATHAAAKMIVLTLPCEIVAVDLTSAMEAGVLHAATRAWGLSLADCCCLALARIKGLPALTADRIWAQLDVGVAVQLIR